MTITLELSIEQENRLRAGAARHDEQAVREVLLQAVDSTVEGILRTPPRGPKGKQQISALLDQIASGLKVANVDPAEEARRQSILASGHPSEMEVLEFIEHAADTQGWK